MLTRYVQCLVFRPEQGMVQVDIEIDVEEEIVKECNCKIINDTVCALILHNFFAVNNIGIAFHKSMTLHESHRDIEYVGTISAIIQRILDESE